MNLAAFQSVDSVARDPNLWEQALAKIRSGEMPPEDDPRPHPDTLAAVTRWIDLELDRVDRTAVPDPGRVTIRRLNRTEYNNTIRDLLGVDLSPADDFPQDDSGYGFDNIGDVLSVSPVLMERYLLASERVARTAVFGPEPRKPTLERKNAGPRKIVESTEVPETYDQTGLSLPNAAHVTHRFPVDGEYLIRVYGGGIRPAASEPVTFTLWIDGREIASQVLDPDGQRVVCRRPAGTWRQGTGFPDHRQRRRALGRRFDTPTLRGAAGQLQRPQPLQAPAVCLARVQAAAQGSDARAYRRSAQALRRESCPRATHRRRPRGLHGDRRALHTGQRAVARKPREDLRVRSSARRPRRRLRHAHRRRRWPSARFGVRCRRSDVARYTALFRQARQRGESFDDGIAVALQALLVSPDFLFRLEQDHAAPAATPGAVSQHELATRLSYFLWASMPDQALRTQADSRSLRKPDVLAAEVRRMLQDPRAAALVREFGGQWLQFRALENVKPDVEKFPDFDQYLRMSMREETERFFDRIVREDRSILEFLDAKYTFLNERLARHYGVPGVTGPAFRLVQLTDPNRGGVITQGSVLTVSSYSTRTSPVLRGKWVLDNLLNAPPPDPPPNVPIIDEAAIGASATQREQLEAHRANPTCAACHRRMDPLGFGLENFDAVGKWRTRDGSFPVDASGALPDGRSFSGPAELTQILASEREAFAKALTSKMLTYALGRGLEPYDRRTVRMIARKLPDHDYRFSGLVLEIVNSLPFQMRRGVATP